jgi:hypothetical protein
LFITLLIHNFEYKSTKQGLLNSGFMNKLNFLRPILLILLISSSLLSLAQEAVNNIEQPTRISVVTKNDGTEYVGIIIKIDEREVLIETKEIGRLYIPKHEIKSIRELAAGDTSSGTVSGTTFFSSRYFLTTNGLRMRKGDSYTLINWYGPEIQANIGSGFTLGAMTTWGAMPIVISGKKSFSLNDNFHIGLGLLAGTLSWANWSSGGFLPYGTLTYGNTRNNVNFTAGYAILSGEEGSVHAPVYSVACHVRITDKVSFVGDSFIYLNNSDFAIIVPGIRISRKPNKAFQIGIGAIRAEGETVTIPIPILGWFLKI